MRTARHRKTATLAVVAVVLLAATWAAVGNRAPEALPSFAHASHAERDAHGTVSPVDLADSVVAPMLGAPRATEPHQAPLWVLPGAAATLAALCLLRRQRLRPTLPARRTFLHGSLASRAPPLESFA